MQKYYIHCERICKKKKNLDQIDRLNPRRVLLLQKNMHGSFLKNFRSSMIRTTYRLSHRLFWSLYMLLPVSWSAFYVRGNTYIQNDYSKALGTGLLLHCGDWLTPRKFKIKVEPDWTNKAHSWLLTAYWHIITLRVTQNDIQTIDCKNTTSFRWVSLMWPNRPFTDTCRRPVAMWTFLVLGQSMHVLLLNSLFRVWQGKRVFCYSGVWGFVFCFCFFKSWTSSRNYNVEVSILAFCLAILRLRNLLLRLGSTCGLKNWGI